MDLWKKYRTLMTHICIIGWQKVREIAAPAVKMFKLYRLPRQPCTRAIYSGD